MSRKITPNLWFDGNAAEAVSFYIDIFPGSKLQAISNYPDSPEKGLADFQKNLAGKELTIDFELAGHNFAAINAGHEFKFNNSISFMVNFDPLEDESAKEHLDTVWNKLLESGEVLVPLEEYSFSKHYGWVKDKYGLTWQLMLTNPGGEKRPCVIPSLMFGNSAQNLAEEAINFYVSVFKDSQIGTLARYGTNTGPATGDSLMYGEFQIAEEWFATMDSAVNQSDTFNEAVSFSVACKDQAEIDYYWGKLSAVKASEQCGWCKDKYGVSWQVVPENIADLMSKPNAFSNLMQMKKIEISNF